MSKKIDQSQIKRQSQREYKKSIKRVWISLLFMIPVFLVLTSVLGIAGVPVWLTMILNVVIGGLICLLVYIIFDKIDQRKRIKEFLEPDEHDPFSN